MEYKQYKPEELVSAFYTIKETLPFDLEIELASSLTIMEAMLEHCLDERKKDIEWYRWMKKYGMNKGYISKEKQSLMEVIKSKYSL